MQKEPNRFWLTALLLGWLFDFLFWKHTPGISFAIYVLVTLVAGFLLLWQAGIRPARQALFLVPLILFFAAMTFLRLEPLSAFLAHGLTLFLMAGLAVTYRSGKWLNYSLADYFSRAAGLVASSLIQPIAFGLEAQRLKREAGGETEKRPNRLWPVLRGLLFALPVVAFFAMLLSAADLVFAQQLQALTQLFNLENLPEYIFRLVYILILAYILAGVLIHAAQHSSDEKLLGLEKPVLPPFLGFTEASIVLGSVVLLFAAFVAIQFRYFFGGQANIQLDGYTYADYARRGFGELVTVAFFALLLFLGLSAITRRESRRQQAIFSGLGLVLLALVGVMLVSAYQRLVLYETAYGFTRLRTYTHVFMIWIAVLLASVVVLDLLQRQRAFALSALLASLGFVISLTLINVDAFIVQRNIQRYQLGEALDVGYLASLSADAVPTLGQLYRSSEVDEPTRERLGASLACFHFQARTKTPDLAWQAFHLSNYQADQTLRALEPDLNKYQFDDQTWPQTVTSPQGHQFECSSTTTFD
jgi:hypothetical protein